MNKRLLLLHIVLLCFADGFSQGNTSTYNDGTAIKFTFSKNGDKYKLVTDENPVYSQQSADKEKDVYGFFYKTTREHLYKLANYDVSKAAKIERFSKLLAKEAAEKLNEDKMPKNLRTLSVDHYQLIETKTPQGEYVYNIIDTLSGGALEKTLFAQQLGVYKYYPAVIKEDVILENWKKVEQFIGANKDITSPQVQLITIGGTSRLYIRNSDNSIDDVTLTSAQESSFKKGATVSTEASPAAAPARGVGKTPKEIADSNDAAQKSKTATASVEKKKEILVDPQKITCLDKIMFDLAVYSCPSSEDSVVLEINTAAVKKLDTIFKSIGAVEFKRLVTAIPVIKDLKCDSASINQSLDLLYAKFSQSLKDKKAETALKEKLDTANKLVAEVRASLNDRIDKLAAEIDFSALLVLAGKQIDIGQCDVAKQVQGEDKQNADGSLKMVIDSVVIRVFNNTIHQLDVVGSIGGTPHQTLTNYGYGLSLRDLIDGTNSLHFKINKVEYILCYTKLFMVRPPFNDAISYSLKDGVYKFFPDSTKNKQLIEQKRLLDFVSASAFLDLQSFNESNPNKNINTELYLNFNINYNHKKNFTFARYTYTNVSLATNIFKESSPIESYRESEIVARDSTLTSGTLTPAVYSYDTTFANRYYFKSFDLFRYAFLQVKPVVNIVSVDLKRYNSFLELNTGLSLLGSNVKSVDPQRGTDSLKNSSVFSYAPLVELRCRLFPKTRFGIDFHLSYLFAPHIMNADYIGIRGEYDAATLVKAKMIDKSRSDVMQGEFNIFFNPKENASPTDRGGLYFKINMLKALKNSDGYFAFMVGYSTDIKNFFK